MWRELIDRLQLMCFEHIVFQYDMSTGDGNWAETFSDCWKSFDDFPGDRDDYKEDIKHAKWRHGFDFDLRRFPSLWSEREEIQSIVSDIEL